MEELLLLPPSPEFAGQVMDYRREMLESGSSLDGCGGLEETDTYEAWADVDRRLREKYGDQYVPSRLYLAVRAADRRLVGMLDFRRPLSPFLLQYGGNIGYSVRPSERRKGYAGQMLALILPLCRQAGETKVLVTCDKDNDSSRRVIVKNGGVLENEVPDQPGLGGENGSGLVQRYWITL